MSAPKQQAGGWLSGIIKEVPSGDTVIIKAVLKSTTGIAPEKRVTLSSLTAPRLGRRDGSTADEPFAWQSREFLRRKAIGQFCVFRTDYVLEQAAGREFGSVYLDNKENLAVSVVAAGWAKVALMVTCVDPEAPPLVQVRQGGAQQSPVYEELVKAEEAAKAARKGVWTTDADAIQAAVRPPPDDNDASSLLAQHGKGKPLPAIVEQVVSGSLLRVTLPEEGSAQTLVFVCGVNAPSLGRKAPEPASNGASSAAPVGGFSSAVSAGINTSGACFRGCQQQHT